MVIFNPTNRIRIARFFQLNEFQCPCCHRVMLHPNLLKKLEKLREYLKKPVFITSGYRCPAYNQKVGGVKTSYHLLGMAADIQVREIPLMSLWDAAEEIYFRGIGFYSEKNFLHLDVRPTQKARWQG